MNDKFKLTVFYCNGSSQAYITQKYSVQNQSGGRIYFELLDYIRNNKPVKGYCDNIIIEDGF